MLAVRYSTTNSLSYDISSMVAKEIVIWENGFIVVVLEIESGFSIDQWTYW